MMHGFIGGNLRIGPGSSGTVGIAHSCSKKIMFVNDQEIPSAPGILLRGPPA